MLIKICQNVLSSKICKHLILPSDVLQSEVFIAPHYSKTCLRWFFVVFGHHSKEITRGNSQSKKTNSKEIINDDTLPNSPYNKLILIP